MKLIVMPLVAMLLISSALLSAQQQPTPPPTPPEDKCSLEGEVVNLVTGEPVRKARLTLSVVDTPDPLDVQQPQSPPPPTVVSTDAQGKFSFVDLEPGAYRLAARHDNYSDQQYGAKKADQPGDRILLAPGTKKTGLELRLTPYATITGRIRDEDGDPMQHVPVAVMSYAYTNSGRQLTERTTASSNDFGEYRIFNLAPGKYYLRAGGIAHSLIAVYYPNSPDPSEASPLELTPGRQLTSVDFTLRRTLAATGIDKLEVHPVTLIDVTGRVRIEGETEVKLTQVRVNLDGQVRSPSDGGAVMEDGAFSFRAVEPDVFNVNVAVPGELYLKSINWGAKDVTESGLDLSAGDPDADLEIVVSANGGQIDGKVENDKSEPVDHALVTLVPPGARRNRTFFKSVRTTPDGHFTITGVAPGIYKLLAWDDVEVNAVLYDPDFLRPFETASQSIQVFEGARHSASLKLIVRPPE
jgi:5-hydroxyisourate hydrolase-like protein (transthyretin family)